ncbi:MAG: DUF2934 domain-containing protein [Gammaproteobacteria bacterium]|jgi:hypothetical protein
MDKVDVTATLASAQVKAIPPVAARRQSPTGTSAEQRLRMIAEAAYYLAEHRGFQGGDPTEDWLQAEAEIDHRLMGTPIH